MFKLFKNESFKPIKLRKGLTLNYAISNYGRLVSYKKKINDGNLVKGSLINGYRIFRYKIFVGKEIKNYHAFFYRLVAEAFVTKPSKSHTYVLHLDRKRDNDVKANLKWATYDQMLAHQSKSPFVLKARKKLIAHNRNADGPKLNAAKVLQIKKILADPKRKTLLSAVAKRFKISEMHLYRIKRGENWGHVKIK